MKSDYQAIAGYFDRYRTFPPAEQAFWLAQMVALGGVSAGKAVLDLGCGTGRFAIPMAETVGATVVGIDRAPAMIARTAAKPGSRSVRWAVGDAESLPLAGDTFDVVLMNLVIHHVERRPAALSSVLRALRPGGRLVMWTSSHPQIRRFVLGKYFPPLIDIDLRRFPSIPLLTAELRAAGFCGIRARAVSRRETVAKDEFIDKVRNRFISTLSLISDEELAAGVRALEADLAALPGDRFVRRYNYTFVTADRPVPVAA